MSNQPPRPKACRKAFFRAHAAHETPAMLWILIIMKLRSLRGRLVSTAVPRLRRILCRAPLRIALLTILIMAFRSVTARIAGMLPADSLPIAGISYFLAGMLTIAFYALLCRLLERRRIVELSRRTALPETAKGLATGFLLITAAVAVMALGGGYRITAFAPTADLFWIFLYCLLTAAAEECVFRGVIYRITERSLGTAAATAVSAMLFGGAHILNPNASLWTSVAIAVEAGVLFGAVYAHCGNLWLPIGIHWAWNFTEGRIWGLPVSGSVKRITLFHAETSGPELLTGGMFGPEASLTVVILCSLLSAYLIYDLRRTGRWMPFRLTPRAPAVR